MKKVFYQVTLCVICAASFSIPTYAGELDVSRGAEKANKASIESRAHDMEYRRVVTNTAMETKDLGAAGGQPKAGVSFTTGGSIYWQDGGSAKAFRISVGNSVANVSIGIGTVTDGVTKYSIAVPPGGSYKMGVSKTIEATEYEIQKRLRGSTGAWKYDSKGTGYEVTHIKFYLIPC